MIHESILLKYPDLILEENQPLSKYTYTQTGGAAEYLFLPSTIEEIRGVIAWTKENDIPLTIIGNGSNVIVRDGGIRGVTIILVNFNNITVEKNKIIAQSGAPIIEVSRVALKQKLTGLEFACGIPGSTGGAVYMNAGAYGGDVSDVIESMTILKRDGNIIKVTNNEMDFSYRYSKLMETDDIVIDVTFVLRKGLQFAINLKMNRLTDRRETSQPLEYPSCGSVFKNNPEGLPWPGKLIADLGLQGTTIGGAQLSLKHPNFIVNKGHASSTDYIDLIEYIQKEIMIHYNIKLEPEPRIIGENKISI